MTYSFTYFYLFHKIKINFFYKKKNDLNFIKIIYTIYNSMAENRLKKEYKNFQKDPPLNCFWWSN